jgi:cell wall-associated NlpC family hydrolase
MFYHFSTFDRGYMRRVVTIIFLLITLTACSSTKNASLIGNSSIAPIGAGSKKGVLIGGSKAAKPSVESLLNQQYQSWQGVPYRYGGTSRAGIDCSAFVQITFQQQLNQHLPRTTAQQSLQGIAIKKSQLRSGDLVFFKTGIRTRHVGIYLGDGHFLHASTNKGVTITPLNDHYWQRHYWQSRRLRH